MNIQLATSSNTDLMAYTNNYILSFKEPAILVGGILLAIFIVEVLVYSLSHKEEK